MLRGWSIFFEIFDPVRLEYLYMTPPFCSPVSDCPALEEENAAKNMARHMVQVSCDTLMSRRLCIAGRIVRGAE